MLIKRIEPQYPQAAIDAGINGKVIVQFFVDKNGNVKAPRAVKTTPPGLGFEEAAIQAVQQWKFTPAQYQGKPAGVWVAQTITFKLK